MADIKLFYTSYSRYLAHCVNLPTSTYLLKKFSDGELYIKLDESVAKQEVWVVAATPPPAENILELSFLLDALTREHARINLILTYYGYSRQDRAAPGEALTSQVIAQLLNSLKLNKIFIIHAHSKRLHDYLSFTNEIPIKQICDIAEKYDAIAAPDKGAYKLTTRVAQECNKEKVFLAKVRPKHEEVKILHTLGKIENKNILVIEDIISTGNTLLEVSRTLKQLGAASVSVYATHGVFAPGAVNKLEASPDIKHIYITNSLYHTFKNINTTKLTVLDIGPFIREIIQKNYQNYTQV